MLGKKEEGDRWGERKEQEKDGSEAVLSHVYFCPPGPGSQDGRGDPPEDVTWVGGIAASLVHYSERPFLCYTCGTASLQRPFPSPPRQMTANC